MSLTRRRTAHDAVVMATLILPNLRATPDEVARFVGEWRGDSTCVAKNTACHDETVVYRIAKLSKPNSVAVSADKIVNGKAVNMGTLEFRYDQDRRMLVCEYSQGVWRFTVDGGEMEGTLTAPDNTVFRRVTLRKEK